MGVALLSLCTIYLWECCGRRRKTAMLAASPALLSNMPFAFTARRAVGIQLQYLMVHLKTAIWGGPQTPTCPLPATPVERGEEPFLFSPTPRRSVCCVKTTPSNKALLYTYLHLDCPSQHSTNSPRIPSRIMIDFTAWACLMPAKPQPGGVK